jgi:hypothetical protein
MNRQDSLDRLDLYENQSADDHVHAETAVNAQVPIQYGQRDLSLGREVIRLQLVTQALLVNRFQEPGPSVLCTANAESTICSTMTYVITCGLPDHLWIT